MQSFRSGSRWYGGYGWQLLYDCSGPEAAALGGSGLAEKRPPSTVVQIATSPEDGNNCEKGLDGGLGRWMGGTPPDSRLGVVLMDATESGGVARLVDAPPPSKAAVAFALLYFWYCLWILATRGLTRTTGLGGGGRCFAAGFCLI